METVAEVHEVIALLGRELGAEPAAAQLSAAIAAELDAVRRQAADVEPVPALITFPMTLGTAGDLTVVGRETFVDELLSISGGANVVPVAGYPRVSVESVVQWAPQAVIISATGDIAPDRTDADYLAPWAQWAAIPAVRRGRVVVRRELYLTLPGPRMGRAAQLLLEVLHGGRSGSPEGGALESPWHGRLARESKGDPAAGCSAVFHGRRRPGDPSVGTPVLQQGARTLLRDPGARVPHVEATAPPAPTCVPVEPHTLAPASPGAQGVAPSACETEFRRRLGTPLSLGAMHGAQALILPCRHGCGAAMAPRDGCGAAMAPRRVCLRPLRGGAAVARGASRS
jgi:hypothetical protein